MKRDESNDPSSQSLTDLFQAETESQTAIITASLLELERNPGSPIKLEAVMRAVHSLKGAARIINHRTAIDVAHAIEEYFVAVQQGKLRPQHHEIDLLFQGLDLLLAISERPEIDNEEESAGAVRAAEFLSALDSVTSGQAIDAAHPAATPLTLQTIPLQKEQAERVLRLTAQNLNRLLGLAGESLVESRWLQPFTDSMRRLKRHQSELIKSLDGLRESAAAAHLPESVASHLEAAIKQAAQCREHLSDRMTELELHDRRSGNLSHRLYREVLQCRMRPFGDGTRRLPRMVRDLARLLGKQARLEVVGDSTQVDREILEKLEAPLGHLLRNAVDHGCEMPEERLRAGKPAECLIRLEARHSAGTLVIVVSDDGAGIQPAKLREHILQKRLAAPAIAEKLDEPELLDFLLRPGFTMRETVTEVSGRGVGLDVVQNMVKSVRGTLRMSTQPGKGMRFQLNLPLTLSVMRALLVEVAEEPYAIPLSQIGRALKLPVEQIQTLEGRGYFTLGNEQIGLVFARQILECDPPIPDCHILSVIVMGGRNNRYGLIVDRFLGERELVVQALDSRLGKVKNISAGALMEDGSPVLIIDVDDLMQSIERLIADGFLDAAGPRALTMSASPGVFIKPQT